MRLKGRLRAPFLFQLLGPGNVLGYMNKILIIAVVAATALAVPALADHRPGHPAPGGGGGQTINLKADTPTVTYNPSLNPPGGSATLSGKINGNNNGGQVVVLEENPAPLADNQFKRTNREATTDAQGNFRMTGVITPVNTQYRVVARQLNVTSNTVTVNVRLRVSFLVSDSTPRRGQRVRFSGKVWPEHDGKPVSIQKRGRDGVYRTIARTVTRDVAGQTYSSYSKRIRIFRTGRFRVVVSPGDADHVRGISRARTLRVG